MLPASSKELFDIQTNYRVWTKSETCTWLDDNIQLENVVLKYKRKIKSKYYLQVAIHKNENKM